MSLVLVAVATPKPGRTQQVLDAFRAVSLDTHLEKGCELYAAHTDQAGRVVVVERWSSPDAWRAHDQGAPVARLRQLLDGLLEGPVELLHLDAVPMGDPGKGAV